MGNKYLVIGLFIVLTGCFDGCSSEEGEILTFNDSAAVTVDDVTVGEGGNVLFTVTLDNAVAGGFDVNVTFTDVTATGGAAPLVTPEDYVNDGVTVTFAGSAGETQTFTVATLDDALLEAASETFTVNLSATNTLVDDSDTGTGTITDSSDWPEISATLVTGGFTNPIDIGHGKDGSGRLFVVEQGGKIWIVMNGSRRTTPFLDISDRVTPTGGEQGLLGLAFPPDFASKGHFYVNYTRRSDGSTVVARYFLTEDPDVADPGSEKILLTAQQPFGNHNGGQLAFGPDGFLYISTGDGGSGGDPMNNAQDVGTLLGKLLRIDVESGADPYGIPPGNPFLGNPNALDEIWSLGLRNPWRFSFDRQTGDIYIADVGQSSLEEVNFQPSSSAGGENYGWKIMEGTRCFISPDCNQSGLTLPVAEYDHSLGDCSVTGGTVYRGLEFPPMQGIYFYGDFCSGRIWGLKRDGDAWGNTLLLDTVYNISTFGEDEEGNLYLADYGRGDIYMIFAP